MKNKRWYTVNSFGSKYETIFRERSVWEKLGYEVIEKPNEVIIKRKNEK